MIRIESTTDGIHPSRRGNRPRRVVAAGRSTVAFAKRGFNFLVSLTFRLRSVALLTVYPL
jgi:hypothetical protein